MQVAGAVAREEEDRQARPISLDDRVTRPAEGRVDVVARAALRFPEHRLALPLRSPVLICLASRRGRQIMAPVIYHRNQKGEPIMPRKVTVSLASLLTLFCLTLGACDRRDEKSSSSSGGPSTASSTQSAEASRS